MATNFLVPTYSQLLQSMLDEYSAITDFYGYDISVDPGSELYLRFSTIASQRAVQYQITNALINSKLIASATGSDLDALAINFGTSRKGATSAVGFVQLISSIPIPLIAGNTLIGPNSLQYQISQTGVYNPNQNVPILSVDQGSNTNLPIGAILTWSAPLANMQSTCLCSVAVTGGIDAEDDQTLRNRLYLSLQAPSAMGNGQNLASQAAGTDALIQQAFVYSNFNGAGTQLIALAGYQTSSYIGRDIPHLLSDGYVLPYGVSQLQPGLVADSVTGGPYNIYSTPNGGEAGNFGQNLSTDTSAIYGQIPGGVANPYATVITTVNNIPSNIAAVLTLPYPVGSAQSGFGNGWLDSTPWPVPDGYYVTVPPQIFAIQGPNTKVIGGTTGAVGFGITVTAPASGITHSNPPNTSYLTYNNQTPTAGRTHIQWVNRSDQQDNGWTVVTATILDLHDNTDDTWNLVLDTPLTFGTDGYDFYGNTQCAVGDYIFPACTNAQNYLLSLLGQYALLGPGQATASQGLLTLGAARYPSTAAQFPVTMGAQVQSFLQNTFAEVYGANINPSNGGAVNTAFTVPAVNAPPYVYVPKNIGMFPSESWAFGNLGKI